MSDIPRSANIIAETDVQLYAVERHRFLNFISGTEFERVLRRLIENRSEETWNLLVDSKSLIGLTDYQLMILESILEPVERKGGGIIMRENQGLPGIFIINRGVVNATRQGKIVAKLTRGDVVGSADRVQRNEPSEFTFSHDAAVKLFFIDNQNLNYFIEKNPGSIIRISNTYRIE